LLRQTVKKKRGNNIHYTFIDATQHLPTDCDETIEKVSISITVLAHKVASLGIHVFWVSRWIINYSRRFEGTFRLRLYGSNNPRRIPAVPPSEMQAITNPATQHDNPEDLKLQIAQWCQLTFSCRSYGLLLGQELHLYLGMRSVCSCN
jgi:hypothetical protein